MWATKSTAPLLREGPKLQALRTQLRNRAQTLGHSTTADPALHILADGRLITPEIIGPAHRFHIPATARKLRLISRGAIPVETSDTSTDPRRLGVSVAAIRANGENIPLTDPRLSSGWHTSEPHARWTDGDAGLSLAGVRILEVDIAQTERYIVLPEAPAGDATCAA